MSWIVLVTWSASDNPVGIPMVKTLEAEKGCCLSVDKNALKFRSEEEAKEAAAELALVGCGCSGKFDPRRIWVKEV